MNNQKIKLIDPNSLNQWLKEKTSDFYLIDVLPEEHFNKVHLPGAQNACVYQVIFMEQINAIIPDKESRIVLYGSGNRSKDAEKAGEKLIMAGYSDTFILSGGLAAWRENGFTLEGESISRIIDPQTYPKIHSGIYSVDVENSIIQWTGRNPHTTHFGTVSLMKGQLSVNNESISGSFKIDMESIVNINLEGDELQPVLIDHLKSDDFFFTRMFPVAEFTITKGTLSEAPCLTAPNYAITGILDLRGIKAEQSFDATLNPLSDGQLAAEAHFDIDRTRWNIIYGSTRFFEYLGMHQVFDLISLEIRIKATRIDA